MDSNKLIIFLILALLSFFGMSIISFSFLDYVFLITILFLAVPGIKDNSLYSILIKLYVFFVLISCVYSWLFNKQNLITVIFHSYGYFAILFFFYLMTSKLSAKETEKILFTIALIFSLCYILQWLLYPSVLFSGAESHADVFENRYRVRLPGSICGYFLLLYSINIYLIEKKKILFLYAALGFIPIIIQGFRSLTALSLISSFLMIPFVTRSGKKSLVYSSLLVIVVVLAFTTPVVQSKMDEMLTRQNNEQTFSNEDYIRFRSFDYYWNKQFTKPYEKIIGGGAPTDKKSYYYKQIHNAIDYYHYYWVDLGIVGLSMVIGIPAVMLLVAMYLCCMWKCKEPRLQYIRFTLFIVLAGSIFTSMELYRKGNILLLSLFLYIEYKYHREQKKIVKLKNLKEVKD